LLKSHQNSDTGVQERIFALFEAEGIEKDRLELLPRFASLKEHFESYGFVDIALDTYPYNGTTTTCEALSMGVPVVTMVGTRHAARVGNSLLRSVGLDDCIADTPEAFGEIAGRLAQDKERLQTLRTELRSKLRSSNLGDPQKFVPAMQEALENMWKQFEASVSTSV
jgi:predicted O-linked N-acetylglucosamine transferase (SPINDLY family)